MITSERAADIRTRNDKLMAWVDTKRGRNGWASYRPEEKPADVPDVTNEERSALEVFDFVNDPPDRYFLYVNERTMKATTWTGDILGELTFGARYVTNMGDTRVPVRLKAINGREYYGTYFKSAGQYARVYVKGGMR